MSWKQVFGLILMAVAVAVVPVGTCQAGTTTVRGKVVRPGGIGLPHTGGTPKTVTVAIGFMNSSGMFVQKGSATDDSVGNFVVSMPMQDADWPTFNGLPNKTVTLQFTKEGSGSTSRTITGLSGDTTTCNIIVTVP